MLVTNTSPYSGKTVTKDLNVTVEQIKRWEAGEKVQNVFSHLSPGDREFMLTGVTEEEWDEMFPEEEDDHLANSIEEISQEMEAFYREEEAVEQENNYYDTLDYNFYPDDGWDRYWDAKMSEEID